MHVHSTCTQSHLCVRLGDTVFFCCITLYRPIFFSSAIGKKCNLLPQYGVAHAYHNWAINSGEIFQLNHPLFKFSWNGFCLSISRNQFIQQIIIKTNLFILAFSFTCFTLTKLQVGQVYEIFSVSSLIKLTWWPLSVVRLNRFPSDQ